MKWIGVFVFVVALTSGCVAIQVTQQAKTDLLGMTKEEVFLCAGPPDSQKLEGAYEFLAYQINLGSKTSHVATGNQYVPVISSTKDRWCKVNLVLKDGRVQDVRYTGEEKYCKDIVAGCLRKK